MSGTNFATYNQPVIVNSATEPVAIKNTYDGPLVVLSGTGGIDFQAGNSTIGGAVFVEGGQNTIAGGPTAANRTSLNGGLQGNWLVDTEGGESSVWFASGDNVAMLGGNDTIHAGGASALVIGTGHRTTLDVFVGPGDVTVQGGQTKADYIRADGLPSGNDLLVGGSGGHNTITAGAGVTTIAGAGSDNMVFVSGTDTIRPGNGHDTVVFDDSMMQNVAKQDLIVGWKSSDTAELVGYDPSHTSLSNWVLGAVLTLPNGTTVTFAAVSSNEVHLTVGELG